MSAKPELLAPAGDISSALAALAAGADALYLGLKHFSARMQAENFSTEELGRLTDLAQAEGRKIYLALNTFLKPGEIGQAARLLRRVLLGPAPDALIVQDLALPDLARQAGYSGEIFFSTLAGLTHQRACLAAVKAGASRVVLPRELSLDEIRLLHAALPPGLGLEVFVHGALCYNVSGRCWWSSYLGGKSGLRGRCVQPCRRIYTQGGREGRFFSCLDLSLDVLVKTLLDMPGVLSWKIEGRKKGAHYVFHTVSAYRLLRDCPGETQARREALSLLELSLGRPGSRAGFLPQRKATPTAFGETKPGEKQKLQTASGLLCGKIAPGEAGEILLKTRMELLAGDFLRVGYEDEPWHQTLSLQRALPKNGSLTLKVPKHKTPKNGTPVFLLDRREAGLLSLLREWRKRLEARKPERGEAGNIPDFEPELPAPAGKARRLDIMLRGSLPRGMEGKSGIGQGTVQGIWLSPRALLEISRTLFSRIFWWLPPVIWPEEEDRWLRLISRARRDGARHFVCNSPWQISMFDTLRGLALNAGPFCNVTNGPAVEALKKMGFSRALVSPELGEEDYLALPGQSPLPLGIVSKGFLPVGITRYGAGPLKADELWFSPKKEGFWSRRYGQNVWLYPAWPLDLGSKIPLLERAGYSTFVQIGESPPKASRGGAKEKESPPRSSEFNWNIGVL
ncbi:MAG: U32 family peptidase [Deltaproteobacteria bacterium]|jgi:putative protease|nr:U32 family peptidase [Deltaproteobacteria bacterium]